MSDPERRILQDGDTLLVKGSSIVPDGEYVAELKETEVVSELGKIRLVSETYRMRPKRDLEDES